MRKFKFSVLGLLVLVVLSCVNLAPVPSLPNLKEGHDSSTLLDNNVVLIAKVYEFKKWFEEAKVEFERNKFELRTISVLKEIPNAKKLAEVLEKGTNDNILKTNNKLLFEYIIKAKIVADKIYKGYDSRLNKFKIK